MRFTSAAILAFASLVFAQTDGFDAITQPAEHSTLQAGEDFEIVWEPTEAYKGKTVTITLIGGPAQKSQDDIEVVASEHISTNVVICSNRVTLTRSPYREH